jgi:hypothetical protein
VSLHKADVTHKARSLTCFISYKSLEMSSSTLHSGLAYSENIFRQKEYLSSNARNFTSSIKVPIPVNNVDFSRNCIFQCHMFEQ